MLLTVTMNPSVDISYRLDEFVLDKVNRTDVVSKTAGGKGLNVARVAQQLGAKVTATGILGGHLGGFIKEGLATAGIEQAFFEIDQESRNCIAILHEDMQSEILESGPTISATETKNFMAHFTQLLASGDFTLIAISGSLPSGMAAAVYGEMISLANEAGIPVILDASGNNLLEALEDKSLRLKAIKPNIDELSAIEGRELGSDFLELKEVLAGARYKNCEWIVLSLGAEGSLVKHRDDFYHAQVPKIKVVNAVGSGDATVAGTAYGLLLEKTTEEVMKIAMTTGVLNALNEQTGSIDVALFDDIYEQIRVEKI